MDSEEKELIDSIMLIENKARKLVDDAQKSASESLLKKEELLRKARERDYRFLQEKEKGILENFEKDKKAIIERSNAEKEKIGSRLGKAAEKNYKAGKEYILKQVIG